MASIKITMRDGTVRNFPHAGRPGWRYTKSVRYDPGVVVVVDEHLRETAIPLDLVAEVYMDPELRSGW